jgi:hypothetical protein
MGVKFFSQVKGKTQAEGLGNGGPKRLFGRQRDEVTRDVQGKYTVQCGAPWRVLLTDINMIKPRATRWLVHVARIGEMRNGYKILVLDS